MSDAAAAVLQLAHCAGCGAHSFPAQAHGCRVCGAPRERLNAVPCTQAVLRNVVTVHAELVPGLPVPSVIGEVELAPGVIEEALIGVHDETELTLGMALTPMAETAADGTLRWRFVPLKVAR
ncbi:MAG TPA: hypothetical protein VFO28_11375 [Burkholderiaceae bacterium]|nr:hypothetical protein [Burkholderiaceae bacterium]